MYYVLEFEEDRGDPKDKDKAEAEKLVGKYKNVKKAVIATRWHEIWIWRFAIGSSSLSELEKIIHDITNTDGFKHSFTIRVCEASEQTVINSYYKDYSFK